MRRGQIRRHLGPSNIVQFPSGATDRLVRKVLLAFIPLISALMLSPSTLSASSQQIVLVVTDLRGETPIIKRVTVHSEAEAFATMQQMQLQPGVQVERQELFHLLDVPVTDPLASKQWSLRAIHAPQAWTASGTGTGVKVAVIDTGISAHSDLVGRVVASKDFVGLPTTAIHGTAVASVIASNVNNGIGVSGVAPGVDLIDATVCSDVTSVGCYADSIAEGIIWSVSQGAQVINLSLGGGTSIAHAAAINYAIGQGVVVIAAAGNEACSLSIPGFNGRYGPNGMCTAENMTDSYPSRLSDVVSVAAIHEDGSRGGYSSYGLGVSIGAPSEVMAATNFNQYDIFTGTSAAAPHVSAVAALMLQANPQLSPAQTKAILMRSTTDYAAPLRQETYTSCGEYLSDVGYWKDCIGISNFNISQRLLGGTGFLNAEAAVNDAKSLLTSPPAPQTVVGIDGVDVTVPLVNGAASYDVILDKTVYANTVTPGIVHISGLLSGSSYSVSVRTNTAAGSQMSAPALVIPVNPLLGAPVIDLARGNPETTIRVSVDERPHGAVSLQVRRVGQAALFGCYDSFDDGLTFRCQPSISSTSENYEARFVNIFGRAGPWSQQFAFSTAKPFLAVPVVLISNTQSAMTIDITRDSGVTSYMVGIVGTTSSSFEVSQNGTVLAATRVTPQCSLLVSIVCSIPINLGVVYSVKVYAKIKVNNSLVSYSDNTPTVRVIARSTAPVVSNIRGIRGTDSQFLIQWDTDLVNTATTSVVFTVYLSNGSVQGSQKGQSGWFTTVFVNENTPLNMDVTVVGHVIDRYQSTYWATFGTPLTFTGMAIGTTTTAPTTTTSPPSTTTLVPTPSAPKSTSTSTTTTSKPASSSPIGQGPTTNGFNRGVIAAAPQGMKVFQLRSGMKVTWKKPAWTMSKVIAYVDGREKKPKMLSSTSLTLALPGRGRHTFSIVFVAFDGTRYKATVKKPVI